LGGFFDAPRKETELENLERQISEPDFWNDQETAQKIVQQRSRIEKALERQKSFETAVSDAEVLLEFAETDKKSLNELTELLAKLDAEVTEAETESLLSGQTDANNAICSIQAGAGGTDAQDFAQMLLRMYLRWAEKKGFKVCVGAA
jgi:peptide chain release factor 2